MKPEVLERIRTVKRASQVLRAGAWRAAEASDRVVLDADERFRRRIVMTGERGGKFLLDLPEATALRDGDGLLLDDGAVVAIVARPEPLVEIAAEGGAQQTAIMARLAWHLGNRHTEVEIVGGRLRMRRDRVLEEMLSGLGAVLTPIEAPFEPERGAYGHRHGEGGGRAQSFPAANLSSPAKAGDPVCTERRAGQGVRMAGSTAVTGCTAFAGHDNFDFSEALAANLAPLYRLMTWMSPAYPVGAFSYSGGLEWAVEAGDIREAASLTGWLTAMIRHGSVFCDAAIFCHAHRDAAAGDDRALAATAELAAALVGSRERFLETTAQGQAFRQITRAAWPTPALDRLTAAWNGPLAYPVAVAAACAGHGIALVPALHAFLHGVVSTLVSAGVRLVPLGQTDGQRVLAALEAEIAQTARVAPATALDDIGSATLRADIAGMRHETQYTRLFRS
jgi:urease accessory protein